MFASASPITLHTILDSFEEYKSSTTQVLNATPASEMWRYFIDYPACKGLTTGNHQDLGWLSFEENNYLKKLTQAFHLALTTPLNSGERTSDEDLAEILSHFQQVATHAVLNKAVKGFINSTLNRFSLVKVFNTTRAGFVEILEDINSDPNRYLLFDLRNKTESIVYRRTCITGEDQTKLPDVLAHLDKTPHPANTTVKKISELSKEELDFLFDFYCQDTYRITDVLCLPDTSPTGRLERVKTLMAKYINQIDQAETMKDRLRAIAILTEKLLQNHPFADGNARSAAILMLNFLLKGNNFPPAIVNPNIACCYSIEEWEQEILRGMNRALTLANHGTLKCISTQTIQRHAGAKQKQEFKEFVALENLCRKIRMLNGTIFCRLSQLMRTQFDAFLEEGIIPPGIVTRLDKICDQLIELNTDNRSVKEFEKALSRDLKIAVKNLSTQFFPSVYEYKLLNLTENLLCTVKKLQSVENKQLLTPIQQR